MSFATDGYEVAPLFSPQEVSILREAVAAHMAGVAGALLKPAAEAEPDAPYDERIERLAEHDPSYAQLLGVAVATDAQRTPAVAALAHDPRIEQIVEEMAGCPVGERIFRFRLNSSALPKGRQAWHSDVARLDGGECSQLVATAWIPLADAGPDTGGLEILPGRRDAPFAHAEGGGKITIDDGDLNGADTVVPTVPAGHCLFLHPFTPHRAVENMSGRTRWSLVVWMKAPVAETGAS
ncbi:MAG TPA: phytanoyl-CoA dioxygenase family protein [Croceibacterium sp.]|nr:phytanoyl-CoA dioxygenase family protein [Croceibacterium sp.]